MRAILDFLGLSTWVPSSDPLTPPQKAVYLSPSGTRIEFDFEDITSSFTRRGGVFESVTGDGTYVQSLGKGSAVLPMAVFIHGDNYETRAEVFLSAILEGGEGLLTHPQYAKPLKVVHLGEIVRADAYVTQTNQTVFTLVFYETTGLQIGKAGTVQQSYDLMKTGGAEYFANGVQLDDVVDQQSFKNRVTSSIRSFERAMKKASGSISGVQGGADFIGDSIVRGIDAVIGRPLSMAQQIQLLVAEPGQQTQLAGNKLRAYKSYALGLFGGRSAEWRTYDYDSVNTFHLNSLMAQTAVGSAARLAGLASESFITRAEYLFYAALLLELLEAYRAWRDSNFEALADATYLRIETADTGGGDDSLTELVTTAAGDLVSKSFQAKVKIAKAIDAPRTIVDLCFELCGDLEIDTLNAFCRLNDFSGDEYAMIEKGRVVEWYL